MTPNRTALSTQRLRGSTSSTIDPARTIDRAADGQRLELQGDRGGLGHQRADGAHASPQPDAQARGASRRPGGRPLDRARDELQRSSGSHSDGPNGSCQPVAAARIGPLTGREQTIMHMVLRGHSSKEIARFLNISVLTVRKHRENMRRKLGVKTVVQLAAAELATSAAQTALTAGTSGQEQPA